MVLRDSSKYFVFVVATTRPGCLLTKLAGYLMAHALNTLQVGQLDLLTIPLGVLLIRGRLSFWVSVSLKQDGSNNCTDNAQYCPDNHDGGKTGAIGIGSCGKCLLTE